MKNITKKIVGLSNKLDKMGVNNTLYGEDCLLAFNNQVSLDKINPLLINFSIENNCELIVRYWNETVNLIAIKKDILNINELNYSESFCINPNLIDLIKKVGK